MTIKDLKKIVLKEVLLSKEVFLLGHENIDLDAFAAMAGFSLITQKFKKNTYFLIEENKIETSTKEAISKIEKNINIINSKEASKLITDKSLLIIFDVNKEKLLNIKNILNKFEKIILIDHHTKTKETINIKNLYIDEKSTSTSEIITDLLTKLKIKIPRQYATILLGGIVLDTNNFMYKMTRKSFYHCYNLLSKGADLNEAQMFLKQDLEEYINRAKMISNTIIDGEIAITHGQRGKLYTSQELAKAADLLLEFKGIKNSFAIGNLDKNVVGISARSVNKLNVGKLMETYGGGGNNVEGAAKVENTSIKKIEEDLLNKLKK